jgi:Mg-chelatase subunit ChlD
MAAVDDLSFAGAAPSGDAADSLLLDEVPPAGAQPADARDGDSSQHTADAVKLEITLTKSTRSVGARTPDDVVTRGVVSIKATPDTRRVPADLVFVLDVSGSMTGNRMDMLQRTLRWLASDACLSPSDRVAVIAFDDTAWIELPLRFMTTEGKAMLRAVADGLGPRGGTDIASGLNKAADVLSARRYINASTAVLLLSDGDDHRAKIRSQTALHALAPVCTVRAVGVGSDHDAALLKHVADTARGEYAFAVEAKEVAPTIGSAVGAAFTTVASRLKELTVTALMPDGTEHIVLTKHEIGTLCCAETKHYTFTCPKDLSEDPVHVEAHLEYHAPGKSDETLTSTLFALPDATATGGDTPSAVGAPASSEAMALVRLQEMREETAAAAAEVSRIMQAHASGQLDEGDDARQQCLAVIEDAVRRIEASGELAADPLALALLEDLRWMQSGFQSRGWHAVGAATLGGGGLSPGAAPLNGSMGLAAMISVQARHTSMRATGTFRSSDVLYATPSIAQVTRSAVDATQPDDAE